MMRSGSVMTPREAAFFVMQAIIDRGRTYAVFLTDDGRTQIMPTDGQNVQWTVS